MCMVRYTLEILALVAVAFGQTAPSAPSITNVTNGAIPLLDYPPASIHLAPRSMATIFGTNLADITVSSVSPWTNILGGTEVHLANDTCFDSSCDLIASLIYVSPAQINFLVPDSMSQSCQSCPEIAYRIVFVRDGQRIDNQRYKFDGPGRLFIEPFFTTWAEDRFVLADYDVVFQVGYDCLFSYSLSDPASCGLSWSQGQHRAPAGAVTDAVSGQLISSQSPVHQGQVITLWMTALYGGMTTNNETGLRTANTLPSLGFGVAQLGNDIPGTVGFDPTKGPFGAFISPVPLWAGESSQFVGLDQVNVAFPTCTNAPAKTEKRYDAFLMYTSVATQTTVRIYLPFVVRPGDPDCQWPVNTTTTLTSSVNPATFGQTVTFTATVSPCCIATGTVTFFDGNTMLGSPVVVQNGTIKATVSASSLSVGTHAITARYDGDDNNSSTSTVLTLTIWTISLTSSPNPSSSGQMVTFMACGIPNGVPGIVAFIDGTTTIGANNNVSSPCSSYQTNILTAGTHSVTARYSDSYGGNTSAVIPQTVNKAPIASTITTLTSSANPVTYVYTPSGGSAVYFLEFTAIVSPPNASGTVKFFDTNTGLGCTNHTCQIVCGGASYQHSSSLAPQATCWAYLPAGTFSITAVYSGDNSFGSSTSAVLTQTVNLSLTSSPNPSVAEQSVTLTALIGWSGTFATGIMTFYDGTMRIGTSVVSNGQATFSTTMLSVGSHSLTAVFSGDNTVPNSTSAVLTQTVTAH